MAASAAMSTPKRGRKTAEKATPVSVKKDKPQKSQAKGRRQADIAQTAAALAKAKNAKKNATMKSAKQGGALSKYSISSDADRLLRAAGSLRPGVALEKIGHLPCREAEHQDIFRHLQTGIRNGGTNQVLYISGMPGTGKTASVEKAIQGLLADHQTGAFVPIHLNAMRLGTPNACFSEIYQQLPGHQPHCAMSAAYGELCTFFSERSEKDPVILLVIDEIDHLITRSQAVLYKVFDWLQLPHSRLILTSISNTMDLPERMLPRVSSRFNIVRVDFYAYEKDQLLSILMQLLATGDAVEAFDHGALSLCAARVAGGSGDIRKAMQLCRRAIEVRLNRAEAVVQPVDVHDLQIAQRDVLRESPSARLVPHLGFKARRFLIAVVMELRSRDGELAPLNAVSARYAKWVTWDVDEELVAQTSQDSDDDDEWGVMPKAVILEQEVGNLVRRLVTVGVIEEVREVGGFRTGLSLGSCLDADDLVASLMDSEASEVMRQILRSRPRNF